MSIHRISREEFEALNIEKLGFFPEKSWFKSSEINIAGTVIKDPIDKDWSYVIVAEEEDGAYRYIKGEVDFHTQEEAEEKIYSAMLALNSSGLLREELYAESQAELPNDAFTTITTIDDQIKTFFKKNPEKLHDLSPRKFEELVASILKDMGFGVELTKATRDGGRDIIAHIKNAVCSYLTYFECKKYAPDNKVGVDIIRQVVGVHHLRKATKSIVVTTGFFSRDAVNEAKLAENYLELKDFNTLKDWLQRY